MGPEIIMLIITREKYKYFFSTFCALDSETEDGESVSSDGSLADFTTCLMIKSKHNMAGDDA